MATSKAEITTLLGRCRKVGWKVELQDNGTHKITFDDRTSYLTHASYSDGNAPKRVLSHLERKGLLDKEKALEEKQAADKTKRLAADRRTAAAAGRKLAAQARLTATAAGPYAGPEEIELSWFLAEHPAPWMRWAIITPEIAKALLERNTDNRPKYDKTTEEYRRVIESDHWHLTHQGIAFDRRGILQDGQHRLQACVDAGRPISVAVFVGMDPNNFKAIDEGRNRRFADLLGKDGQGNANLLSAAVRLVTAYREPYPRAYLRRKITNETLYDAFKGDPGRLADAVNWGRRHAAQAKVVGGALSAARYLTLEANGTDNQYVHAFFEGLATGYKPSRMLLAVDDPRALARIVMENRRGRGKRLNAIEQVGILISAWNQLVAGKHGAKYLRWAETQQDIPSITVCRDKGRNASAPPEFLLGEFVGKDER